MLVVRVVKAAIVCSKLRTNLMHNKALMENFKSRTNLNTNYVYRLVWSGNIIINNKITYKEIVSSFCDFMQVEVRQGYLCSKVIGV